MVEEYLFPETVRDVVTVLDERNGRARTIAGGTDLMLDVANLSVQPKCFVDLRNVRELEGVYERGGSIVIGAKTTHAICAGHPLVRRHAPALSTGCGVIGSTQIRNIATLAGNVASANPAADSAVVLTALEAVCVVVSRDGSRDISMPEMYAGVGRSSIDSSRELITHIRFPAAVPGKGSAYERLSQRKGLSLPMVCAAVTLRISGGVIEGSTVVAAPLAPGPTRIFQAEAFLAGRTPDEETFAQAGAIAAESVRFRSSPIRGSAEYRHRALAVLVRRALGRAAADAVKKEGTPCR